MNGLNELVLDKDKVDAAELGQVIAFLIKHEYNISIDDDEYHYIIHYADRNNYSYGGVVHMWVSFEEFEHLMSRRADYGEEE